MRVILTILFLINVAYGQLNIKSFGARESYADNSKYIQKAIDSAVKTGKTVIIPKGVFKVGKPLIAHNWNGSDYGQVYIKIVGESNMWKDISVLQATFGDAPLLSIQKGKGCIIEGIVFNGTWQRPGTPYNTEYEDYTSNTRDSRFSPYCAIAIDPFSYLLPYDGGYPGLSSWYRGGQSRGGSTAIFIRNCVFNGFTVGAITSPNGITQNAELITFENIQIINCKAGFAGCQAQEKMNRIINVGAWGTTHTLFVFNKYGEQTPGHWIIDGVNIAGEVNQIVNRLSGGYFPLMMSNIYAESIFKFGFWHSYVGDVLSDFVIDFGYPDGLGLPKAYYEGGGITLRNGVTRVYGHGDWPIVFSGGKKKEKDYFTLRDVRISDADGIEPNIYQTYNYDLPDGFQESDCFYTTIKGGKINHPKAGKTALFLDNSNTYYGYAILTDSNKVVWKSTNIKDGDYYKILIK